MSQIAEFLFEAQMLKRISRTGYQFLGIGNESVAEHTFVTIMIAWVMAQMDSKIKEHHLILMCLMHDLPETRMGDLNYVQQKYVKKKENMAIHNATYRLPFDVKIKLVIDEFNKKQTLESKIANDADQLAFIIDLKYLADKGFSHTLKWIEDVKARLITSVGQKLLKQILSTESDSWWNKIFIDKITP